MLYIFIKNIIESILQNYQCPQCQNKTNEQSINISAISSHGMDVHIHCHICGIHSQINAEVNTLTSQILWSKNGKKIIEEFLSNGWIVENNTISQVQQSSWIKDEDIAKVKEDIGKAKSVEDFMS